MPNGDNKRDTSSQRHNSSEYNREWCDERHGKLDVENAKIWEKLDGFNNKLWTIIVGQVAILGGIVAAFLKDIIGG